MASRNRVIYQSEGLYVSSGAASTGAPAHEQLNRVQSANYSFTINRQDVNQFGDLARIDSLVLDPPTVSLDFSYYLTDGFNEKAMGFFVQNSGAGYGSNRGVIGAAYSEGNFASGHLTANSGVNFFIVTSPEGQDLNKGVTGEEIDASDTILGIGNCYVSDYSVDLSVGSLPTVSLTVEGANMNSAVPVSAGGGLFKFESPAVDQEAGTKIDTEVILPPPTPDGGITGAGNVIGPAISALRPGDVTVGIGNIDGESLISLSGDGNAHVQSVSISLPLSRSPIDRLGSRFPFAREVDFPVNASMNISAIVNNSHAQNLADIIDSGVQSAQVTVTDKNGTDAIIYTMKGLKVDSQSFSSSIGSNKTVDLVLSTQIGGPNDTDNGVFMSGCGRNLVYV
tara:strand:- start:659 stop:1843 length:1185 start_codon:yes stop_codon:yes gene_type:complete